MSAERVVNVIEIRDETGLRLQTVGKPSFHEILCECHPSDYRITETEDILVPSESEWERGYKECEARFLERILQDMRRHHPFPDDDHLAIRWQTDSKMSSPPRRYGEIVIIRACVVDA